MSWKGSWGNQQAWQPANQQQKPQWGGGAQAIRSAAGGVAVQQKGAVGMKVAPTMANANAGNQVQAKLAKSTKDIETTETMTNRLIENSKTLMENEKATYQSYKGSIDALEKQQAKLSELQKSLGADLNDARRAGPTAGNAVFEITKLSNKSRTLWQTVTMQVNKMKPKVAKLQAEADSRAKEVKDANLFKATLAKVTGDVTTAEKAAAAVVRNAAPLITSPPEEGEARDKKVEAVVNAATEAVKKLDAAKADLSEKMKGIQGYAPETKKTAITSLVELQKKLAEAVKQMGTYKNFKAQLPKLAENQKVITEVNKTLAGHDAAITKASDVAKAATLTKSKVDAIDKHLEPVNAAMASARQSLAKLSTSDAATLEKVTKLRTRIEELKKKVAEITTKIKGQRDAIKAEEGIDSAKELTEAAESAWKECQEAEMPFLMGVEVLASEENDKALESCKTTGDAMMKAVNAAKTSTKAKLSECAGYEKELQTSTRAELNPLMKKIEELDSKYQKFRKELNERKVLPFLSDAIDAVEAFEKKVKDTEAACKGVAATDLEEQSIEAIGKAIEEAKKAFAEAGTSKTEAENLAREGQKKANAPRSHPSIVAIHEGLSQGQAKLGKIRASLSKAESVLKTKNAITTGEEKVKEGEAGAKSAKKSIPKGDTFTLEQATAIDEACASAKKLIAAAGAAIQPHVGVATPKVKEALQALLERNKVAQAAVTELVASTKDKREDARAKNFIAEGETKTKTAEAASGKLPELEGKKLTEDLLKSCTEAVKAAQDALNLARSYSQQRIAEAARQFGEAASKSIKDGFKDMNDRITTESNKVSAFDKLAKEKTKELRMTEAGEKVDEAEALLKKVVAAAEPFAKEGAESMTEAQAKAPLEAFMEADQEFNKKVNTLSSFLQSRLRDQAGNKETTEVVKKLQERVTEAKKEATEKKKGTKVHEQRALATKNLAEAKEQVGGLEAEVKKAKDACSALLEDKGEQFLTSNAVQTLANALQAHMAKETELTVDSIFKEIGKGKPLSEKAFVRYLASLPADIDRDELNAFSDERRLAIFKHVASSKGVTQEDFANIFKQQCNCIKSTALTNQYEVEGSETLCKVEPSTSVEIFGRAKTDDKKLTRSEAKVGDKTGWITIKQDNMKYLTATSPFTEASKTMDKALADASSNLQNIQSSIAKKIALGKEDGPHKDAKEELEKLKAEVTKQIGALSKVRNDLASAKGALKSKEQAEKNAHIEARNQKEAAPFLEGPKAKVEALEADANAVVEAGAPMVSLTGDDLQKFDSPASVAEAVEKLSAAVKEKADEAREAVKEQTKALSEVTPQTAGTAYAKKNLQALSSRITELAGKATNTHTKVTVKCKGLIAAKLDPTADAIRQFASKQGKTLEDFFKSLKKGEKIPEAAFCKMLTGLELKKGEETEKLSPELAKLLCRKLELDGISKDVYLKFVVLYYKVVKTITFTDAMDITACKTLRKLEVGEVVEVLEGPVTDPSNAMTRINARSTKEDKQEGWITLSGSKGTAFLEKTNKPFVKPTPK